MHRPYQTASIAAVEAQFRAGVLRTLLVLPTGCGKTVVFAELVRRVVEALATWAPGARALVIAHRTELLDQAAEKLHAVGVRSSIDQGSSKAPLTASVVVGSLQTLRGARLERYPADHFAFIVIDEAHHAAAASYQAIFERFASARILGVTATPRRADGKALGDSFQSVAHTYGILEAIREKFLAPIHARRVSVDVDLSKVKTARGDFDQSELAAILIAEKSLHEFVSPLMELTARRKRVLVFAADVPHAKALAEVINRHEPGAAMSVDGSAKPAERKSVLALYRRGAFRFLINCALYTEGFDEPAIDCVAMCRPTQSWVLYTQMLGRGTRLSPATGKENLLVLDFVGNCKHRLIGPLDALAGGPLAPEAVEAAEKLLDEDRGQTELDALLAQVDAEVEAKRLKVAMTVLVHYQQREIDPFVGDFMEQIDPTSRAAHEPATARQLEAMTNAGFSTPPEGLSKAQASAALSAIEARRKAGLSTIGQSRLLGKYGLDCKAMTFERAQELCIRGKAHNWKPFAFAFEPERRKGRTTA